MVVCTFFEPTHPRTTMKLAMLRLVLCHVNLGRQKSMMSWMQFKFVLVFDRPKKNYTYPMHCKCSLTLITWLASLMPLPFSPMVLISQLILRESANSLRSEGLLDVTLPFPDDSSSSTYTSAITLLQWDNLCGSFRILCYEYSAGTTDSALN